MKPQTQPVRKSTFATLIRALPLWIGVLLATLPTGAATYNWTNLTSGDWSIPANWSPNGTPNGLDESVNINSALTVGLTGGPFTFGTLATTIGSGSVVIGDSSITTDQLTAQVSSGTPTFNVVNSGGTVFFYANLLGNQGFTKTGAGKFTFRFNGADQAYTGNINIAAGVLGINQNGSLGDNNNDITIANGARLLAEPGSNSGTITLPSSRTITLTGAQSQIGANNAAVNLVVEGNVTEDAAGKGLVKTDAGKVTLAGSLSYSGETRIAGGTLALTGSAALPTSQNLRFNGAAVSTLDLGGTAQTVRTIVMDITTHNRVFTGGGALTINGDANQQLSANNGVTYDFAGLNNFTFDRATRQFNVQTVNAAGVTALTDVNLAKSGPGGGTNSITASQVLVGGGNSDGNNGNTARLHLGTENNLESALLQVGGFNAGGIVDFQGGLANPNLKLRGTDGVSAMATVKIGETSSGSRRGEGVVNLTGGSLDAFVGSLTIGRHVANAGNNDSSSLTMPAGSLNATTIILSDKTGTAGGAVTGPTLTAVLTQGGGTVKANTIVMGQDSGVALNGGAARLLPTYNLNGGTLFAASIDGGGGNFAANSARTLNLNNATLRNYDSATDLSVSGVDATAAGKLNLVLGASGGTIYADSSRKITFDSFAPISGAGGLTKEGGGTLLLNNANTFLGNALVNAGTLGGTGSIAAASIITAGGSLAPGNSIGTLTFGSTLDLLGSLNVELDRLAGQNADLIIAAGNITLGGTLNVANIGTALQFGDAFDLFTGNLVGPGFSALNLPSLDNGWSWDTSGVSAGGNGLLTVVPEPTMSALLGCGLVLLGFARRNRSRA